LIWEVVDNAVDEAMAGYCTRIEVTLLANGGCRVSDNGRGIPVEPIPGYPDKTAAEVVLRSCMPVASLVARATRSQAVFTASGCRS
jgi:DNA gyrase/topoisomerase IV subunit B